MRRTRCWRAAPPPCRPDPIRGGPVGARRRIIPALATGYFAMMHKLVLLRHGQSVWNLENLFTGWTDVDLSEQGRDEAREAGRLLREAGYEFDLACTSVL